MGGIAQAASGIVSGGLGLIAANNLPQNTYNANAPNIQQQDLVEQLKKLSPQQQELTKMLMSQAQGQGPNPAQEMLKQATNRNIQQTAGAIASTRGMSPALAARLAAQTGAATGQTAAGQGALMGAQQQLAGQNALSQNLISREGILQQAQAAQNAAITQGSLGAQGINAGVASQNTQNRTNAIGGAMQGFGAALGAGGGGGGGGGGASLMGFMAHGGVVPQYADGGSVDWQALEQIAGGNTVNAKNPFIAPMRPAGAAKSDALPDVMLSQRNAASPVGQSAEINAVADPFSREAGASDLSMMRVWEGGNVPPPPAPLPPMDRDKARQVSESFKHVFAVGGEVPAMLSPGEVYIPPSKVEAAKRGNPLKEGRKIPGKAKRKGDHPENDTHPDNLEVGGVVLPKSVTEGAQPINKAKRFMQEISGRMNADIHPKGFSQVLKARQHLQNAHASLMQAHKTIKSLK